MDILRLISSGSKSMVELPSSTRPRTVIMPVSKRIASARELLPAPAVCHNAQIANLARLELSHLFSSLS